MNKIITALCLVFATASVKSAQKHKPKPIGESKGPVAIWVAGVECTVNFDRDAAQDTQLTQQKNEESSLAIAIKTAIDTGDVETFKKILYAGADSEQKITKKDDYFRTRDPEEEMVLLQYLLWRLEYLGGNATQESTCQMIEDALYYGARTDIKVLLFGKEETLDSHLQKKMSWRNAVGGYSDDPYLCEAVWNVEARNKELADQTENILASEFLVLELAKIVSDYIVSPMQ